MWMRRGRLRGWRMGWESRWRTPSWGTPQLAPQTHLGHKGKRGRDGVGEEIGQATDKTLQHAVAMPRVAFVHCVELSTTDRVTQCTRGGGGCAESRRNCRQHVLGRAIWRTRLLVGSVMRRVGSAEFAEASTVTPPTTATEEYLRSAHKMQGKHTHGRIPYESSIVGEWVSDVDAVP